MHILLYNEIDIESIEGYEKLKAFLEVDDFRSADVKKIGDNLYRARLDRSNRLLFSLFKQDGERYALILEYIRNHAYDRSKFLRGASKVENIPIASINALDEHSIPSLPCINPAERFHVLDKILSFDAEQTQTYQQTCPLIIIGSAGSGKTAIVLEKIKALHGSVLYVTQSPYLARHSRSLYFANDYSNAALQTTFLSFQEFVESIHVPSGEQVNLKHFMAWFSHYQQSTSIHDPHALYEEFRGVLTGSAVTAPFLECEDYLGLGIRQAIFLPAERRHVYELFEKYLAFLEQNNLYDTNILCFSYLSRELPAYDYIVVDEIQDLTNVQLMLLLKSLKQKNNFILCGDSNQIVHPNFFSWTLLKSLILNLHQHGQLQPVHRILNTNYRNSKRIIQLANQVLALKNVRFGSIDRESHFQMHSGQQEPGRVTIIQHTADCIRELDQKTHASTKFAVIVLTQEQKAEAEKRFRTPLIFSIRECKGLEYENIILYNFVSSQGERYRDMVADISPADLEGEFVYSRNKNKEDKSLEIYKFFINALYVAITRSITNLFWVEEQANHPLLALLGLTENPADLQSIDYHTSATSDWQQQAQTLESLGNSDQAKRIRTEVLRQETPDWKVYAGAAIGELMDAALVQQDKKAKLQLFEYTLVYEDHHTRHALMEISFKPALTPEAGREQLLKKYFLSYQLGHKEAIQRQLNRYGVDFRNPFNQTPLMVACWIGNADIVGMLRAQGADWLLADNKGHIPFQIALEQACLHPWHALHALPKIYHHIAPPTLNIQLNDQLITLSCHDTEYFLVHIMMALFYRILPHSMIFQNGAFTGQNLAEAMQHFPRHFLPEAFTNAANLQRLLEAHSDPANGQPLFVSLTEHNFLLNPNMKLNVEGTWLKVYEILWFDDLAIGLTGDERDLLSSGFYNSILREITAQYKAHLGLG